jgi:hypothetical protein
MPFARKVRKMHLYFAAQINGRFQQFVYKLLNVNRINPRRA